MTYKDWEKLKRETKRKEIIGKHHQTVSIK